MDRIWIVLKSEYLRRVRSKAFILTTLLLPLGLAIFVVIIALLAASAFGEEDTRTIMVVDETGELFTRLAEDSGNEYNFAAATVPIDSLRAAVMVGTYDGYLVLDAGLIEGDGGASYYSAEGGGSLFEARLERRIERVVEARRLEAQQVPPEVLQLLNADVDLRTLKLTEEGEEAGNTAIFIGLGFAMGFLIFMMMIVYGSVVMQGVIDEKTSRVVEVIVSSVKPFQLMMGKVLGIGAMGLTQMIAWSVLILGTTAGAGTLVAFFIDPSKFNLPEGASTEELLAAADITIPSLSPWLFVWFVVFFVLGYLLYASFYAAIGSAVESQQDAQGFLLPLLLPVIISMYTLVPQVESPDSTLSLVLSLFPLTAPISMVVRMAVTEVPFWQAMLSVVILFGSFLGSIWLSARIYRVGILMYGKKASLADLIKWVRYA